MGGRGTRTHRRQDTGRAAPGPGDGQSGVRCELPRQQLPARRAHLAGSAAPSRVICTRQRQRAALAAGSPRVRSPESGSEAARHARCKGTERGAPPRQPRPLPEEPVKKSLAALALALPVVASAANPVQLSAGDTALVLVSAGLVLLMTPGLAFFYGGLVRAKNVVHTMNLSIVCMGIVGVLWTLVSYSLAFSPGGEPRPGDRRPVVGRPLGRGRRARRVARRDDPALRLHALPGHVRGHHPRAHLRRPRRAHPDEGVPPLHRALVPRRLHARRPLGVGAGGLAAEPRRPRLRRWHGGAHQRRRRRARRGHRPRQAARACGRRRSSRTTSPSPSSAPASSGSGGSASTAARPSPRTASPPRRSRTPSSRRPPRRSPGASLELFLHGKMSGVGLASGAVAGMVAITPAAGFIRPVAALALGALAAMASFAAVRFRPKLGLDDSLDVFAVHGVAASLGAILTGAFASTAVNAGGADASLALVAKQALGVVVTLAFSGGLSFALLKLVGARHPAPRRRAGRVGGHGLLRGRRARLHPRRRVRLRAVRRCAQLPRPDRPRAARTHGGVAPSRLAGPSSPPRSTGAGSLVCGPGSPVRERRAGRQALPRCRAAPARLPCGGRRGGAVRARTPSESGLPAVGRARHACCNRSVRPTQTRPERRSAGGTE